LEGAVLVGDIPVPVFHVAPAGAIPAKTISCEYFYMDLWDITNNHAYSGWEDEGTSGGPWKRWNSEYYTLDRNYYGSKGDQHLEIWVSRIYATNLLHLRAAGVLWGTFLEEYQIIDAYFDKVHARMTTPVTTRRGFGMGLPPGFSSGITLRTMSAMGNLDLNEINYYDNMADLRLNQAAAWQALLQSGKPGNSNWGAYQGTRFTYTPYQRNCQTYLTSVTYEWAAFFAHSSPTLSIFHMYGADGCYKTGGAFFNVNGAQAWTKKKFRRV
jgi:hypothetical protein